MKLAHAARDVVVAKIQNREAERGFFFGDLRTYAASAHGETNAPFRFNAVLLPFDRVAIDFGLVSIRLKERTDCVVPHHFVGSHNRRRHPLLVDFLAISVLTQITLCFAELFTELRFQLHVPGCFARKLDRSSCVVHHLNRLESGKLVEEPTAAGVHQHCVALHFEHL